MSYFQFKFWIYFTGISSDLYYMDELHHTSICIDTYGHYWREELHVSIQIVYTCIFYAHGSTALKKKHNL